MNVSKGLSICIDGYKTQQGGCGIYSKSVIIKLSTVEVKLTGITIATKELTCRNISSRLLTTTLLSLDRPRITSRLILESHQTLGEAPQRNVVTLSFIQGHGNSKENRDADRVYKGCKFSIYSTSSFQQPNCGCGHESYTLSTEVYRTVGGNSGLQTYL